MRFWLFEIVREESPGTKNQLCSGCFAESEALLVSARVGRSIGFKHGGCR